MTTLLIQPEEIELDELRVEGQVYRHLFRARRLAVGERIRVVDGRGRARWSEVVGASRRVGILRLLETAPTNEVQLELHLLVAPPRPERAAWLVEKATELGVAAIGFLSSRRAPREYGAATLSRLIRVAQAALQQCEGSRLPELTGVHSWDELGQLLDGRNRCVVLDSTGDQPIPESSRGSAALLVGPEGGWTEAERRDLAQRGCQCVGLGQRILRVETAAVAGSALLLLGSSRIDTPPGSGYHRKA